MAFFIDLRENLLVPKAFAGHAGFKDEFTRRGEAGGVLNMEHSVTGAPWRCVKQRPCACPTAKGMEILITNRLSRHGQGPAQTLSATLEATNRQFLDTMTILGWSLVQSRAKALGA